MLAEFEEKQFEQAINYELIKNHNLLYTPGQVLENILGFDVALFTVNWIFWKNFPEFEKLQKFRFFRHFYRFFDYFPEGSLLCQEFWYELDKEIDNNDFFPKIKFNAFIQHKRPNYLASRYSSEWNSWNSPYFRYAVIPHQQKALELLDNKIQQNGIVVYACPAFYTLHDLWESKKTNQLVSKTNFCQVSRIQDHKVYTFKTAGNFGISHSNPENIESKSFLNYIKSFSDIKQSSSNKNMLHNLAQIIDDIMSEDDFYGKTYNDVKKQYYEKYNQKLPELSYDFLKINIFTYLTNSTYMIGY